MHQAVIARYFDTPGVGAGTVVNHAPGKSVPPYLLHHPLPVVCEVHGMPQRIGLAYEAVVRIVGVKGDDGASLFVLYPVPVAAGGARPVRPAGFIVVVVEQGAPPAGGGGRGGRRGDGPAACVLFRCAGNAHGGDVPLSVVIEEDIASGRIGDLLQHTVRIIRKADGITVVVADALKQVRFGSVVRVAVLFVREVIQQSFGIGEVIRIRVRPVQPKLLLAVMERSSALRYGEAGGPSVGHAQCGDVLFTVECQCHIVGMVPSGTQRPVVVAVGIVRALKFDWNHAGKRKVDVIRIEIACGCIDRVREPHSVFLRQLGQSVATSQLRFQLLVLADLLQCLFYRFAPYFLGGFTQLSQTGLEQLLSDRHRVDRHRHWIGQHGPAHGYGCLYA